MNHSIPSYIRGARRSFASPMFNVTAGLFLVGLILTGLACSSVRPASLTVPLEWRGDAAVFPVAPGNTKIFILPVEDKRPDVSKIGENQEKTVPVPIMAGTDKTPAVWVREVLTNQMRSSGINVVNSPEEADRLILISLNQFWIIETGSYKAQVAMSVQVQDKTGRNAWTGTAAGEGGNFGKSLDVTNYQETFSRAVSDTWKNLEASGFILALTATTPAPATPMDMIPPSPPPAR